MIVKYISYIITSLVSSAFIIFQTRRILKKQGIFAVLKYDEEKYTDEIQFIQESRMHKAAKSIHFLGTIIFTCMTVFGLIIPVTLDLPTFITKDYTIITGEIVYNNNRGDMLYVESDGFDEVMEIVIKDRSGVEIGQEITIEFLPHTKLGEIVRD